MLYPRKIFPTLLENVKNRKIIVLTGARQVGKTTLLKMIRAKIAAENNSVFLDMDLLADQEIGRSLESFLDFLRLNGYSEKNKRFFIFIDEFQRVPEMATLLKNIFDHYPNLKVFVSGSSSLSIKRGIQESLAGRKFVFEVFPLDFEEFLDFKEAKEAKKYFSNIERLKAEKVSLPESILRLWREFLSFGGYPEVALSSSEKEKKKILQSIFDLYAEKDILLFLGIENLWAFKKLIELLAIDSGNLVNFNHLAAETGLHNKTVRSYISLLEETYLIKILRPFSRSRRGEIVKSPKIYFLDNGVRNFFLNNFNVPEKRSDKGVIFESYILQEIMKGDSRSCQIKFWRTKQKEEVDFILQVESKNIPLEAKFKATGRTEEYRQVLKFLVDYKEKKGIILNSNLKKTISVKGKIIKFIPAVNFWGRIVS